MRVASTSYGGKSRSPGVNIAHEKTYCVAGDKVIPNASSERLLVFEPSLRESIQRFASQLQIRWQQRQHVLYLRV